MTEHSMKSMAGQPVIALDTAEEVGKVKHFVVTPDVARIDRLHIDGRKSKATFADWESLESFGADRVMISTASAPSESSDERDIDAAKGTIELLGTRILDTAGFEHGPVADATFDSDTGAIISISTSDNTEIPAANLHSLGSYALIVDADR